MAHDKDNIKVEVRNDGIYLIINTAATGRKISRNEVLNVVEKYRIQNMDFVAIKEIFESDSPIIEKKISSNKSIHQKGEEVIIEISADKMSASMRFTPPINDGNLLTVDEVVSAVNKAGIMYDIQFGMLEEKMYVLRSYKQSLIIATGTPAIDGKDGYHKYTFDVKSMPTPKLRDDGTVDFHSLGIITMCHVNTVLVTSIPPTEGKDGINVIGKVIPHKKGKPAPALPKGKNVRIEDDQLLSEISGQIIIENNKVSISPVHEVGGNVDNSTGDIDFIGSVMIRGNVLTGFSVRAGGNIEVMGVLEGGTLISDANIILHNGAQGLERAVLKARGDINAKFLERCKMVEALGNINAESIMHSNVKCNGNLTLLGKKALLVGGKIIVGTSVTAKTIGSNMGTLTDIEVGHDPDSLMDYKHTLEQFKTESKKIEEVEKIISMLTALKNKINLPEDKKNILLKSLSTRLLLRDRLNQLQSKLDTLKPLLNNYSGFIKVETIINPGVKVLIGNAVMQIRDPIYFCTLRNDSGVIKIGEF